MRNEIKLMVELVIEGMPKTIGNKMDLKNEVEVEVEIVVGLGVTTERRDDDDATTNRMKLILINQIETNGNQNKSK